MSSNFFVDRDHSWIDYYTHTIGKMSDVNPTIVEQSGLFLISTCAKRNFYYDPILSMSDKVQIKFYHRGKRHFKSLNLFLCYVALSVIGRKTFIIIDIVQEEFLRPLFIASGLITTYEDDGEVRTISPFLPTNFNPSTFVAELSRRYDQYSFGYGVWLDDEVTAYIQRANSEYMQGMNQILSKMYDNKPYEVTTRAHGLEQVNKPYPTIFVGGQPSLPRLLNEIDLEQGLWNRMLVTVDSATHKEFKPKQEWAFEEIDELRIWLQRVLEFKGNIRFFLAEGTPANEEFIDFSTRIHKRIASGKVGDLHASYYGALIGFATKLASLYELSRISIKHLESLEKTGEKQIWPISKDSMINAIIMCELAFKSFKKFVSMHLQKQRRLPIYSEEANISTVWNQIKEYEDENDGEWCPHWYVTQRTRILNSGKFRDIIIFLEESKSIEIQGKIPPLGQRYYGVKYRTLKDPLG